MFIRKFIPMIALTVLLTGCGGSPVTPGSGLRVVASTTILGDVVAQVGGDLIDLTVLFPTGADPHTFDPRPQDIAAISDAPVVFISGLGLEESLQPALDANARGTVVQVSEGVDVRTLDNAAQTADPHGNENVDPHTWTDPNNVIVWTQNITATLAKVDPAHADTYRANADAYIASLRELDAWIRSEVAQIPPERRKLVTDHYAFGYFADEYGFEQVGALVGSFSTNASPSAQEIAALEDAIRAQNVPAVFVGATVNPTLAEQVAQDTGTKIVSVYTGSLTAPGGEADSYVKFMRYNVNAIVNALK
jgi:manganese/iron transport system substrate-binding protein